MTRSTPPAYCRILCWMAVLAACCVASSCSNDRAFELTLILRDDLVKPSEICAPEPQPQGALCRFDFEEQVWRDEAGGNAVVPERKAMVTISEEVHGDYECGDRVFEDTWAVRAYPLPPPDSDPYRVELDDGSVLVLLEEEGLDVTFEFMNGCSDYSGTWRGVAGDLEDRTGTFRSINDTVQIRMHLVEN